MTLGLLTAIQKESGRYERFPKLLEENHCVETIVIKNEISNSPGVLICYIYNYQEMYSLPFYYKASSLSLCGALAYGL